MRKQFYTLLGILLLPVLLYSQTIVKVASDYPPQEGNLNTAVQQAIDAGTLSNTIFELEPYGYYVLTGTIIVPAGQTLTITAPDPGTTQETAPPQIVWTSSGGVNTQFNFEVFGNMTAKNIWIRYANTSGNQVGSSLQFSEDPNVTEQVGIFDNVIFDYAPCPANVSSGAIGVATSHFKGIIKNSYFKNCIDPHLRYYGRAVSFPYNTTGFHINSIEFENCTFANMGYVYMQEGGEYADDVRFNHCTFLNVIHFAMQSGWWKKLSVTNSLFVNTFMYGDIPAQTGDGDPNGGILRIDSVSTFPHEVPFTEADRRILFTNSAYVIQDWLKDWMRTNPYSDSLRKARQSDMIPVPQPMLSPNTLVFFDSVDAVTGQKAFPYMNRKDLYDGIDPEFVLAPTDLEKAKDYMRRKWSNNSDADWAWKPENDFQGLWPLEENLSYANTTLKTAGMGGFPLGDLRWWPAEFEQWKAQADAEKQQIDTWLNNGLVVSAKNENNNIPSEFSLSQNYPNPFNPTTQINYSIAKEGNATLKVFNLLGQEIMTIKEGFHQAGNYTIEFNGTGLSSGMYVYRLQSGDVTISKKFMLMK